MADDTISRRAAIDVIDKIFPADPMRNDYTKGITCGAALAKTYVEQLPSAERKGKWIEYNATGKKQWMCSECCAEEKNPKVARFCYWCGAYMRGEEDG